ncbi:MAG: rane protein [Proteobacteria bacterium]|nr:rane protein [Pseudomonadota bacterium]
MSTPALAAETVPHSLLEDALAILIGTLAVSFGVILLRQTGALTGGTAGLAFLIHYLSGIPFGTAFFVINLPFYYLAVRRKGWDFTIRTFCTVGLVSAFSNLHPQFIHIDQLQPFYAAIFGNMIMGMGFVVLFRHKASLGGFTILALYMQERYGIRAGKLQMAVDVTVVLASLFVVSLPLLIASIAGALILNLIIALNHRPQRYRA